jgi:hypothetical protein
MEIFLLLVIVIGAIVAIFWYRKTSVTRRLADTKPAPHPFQAVAVKAGKGACDAARQLGEKRFLAKEAPPLPLQNCTAKDCRCRYVHYDDRRGDERREQPRPPYAEGIERRSRGDRRRASS